MRWNASILFERYSERARQVVVLAQDEARSLGHSSIGTEHILLGLLREEDGRAATALGELGVTVERAHAELLRGAGRGDEASTGMIPFTPRAKKVLELAVREALSLGRTSAGTEHLLLGLLREDQAAAVRILVALDVDLQTVRVTVLRTPSVVARREPGRVAGRRAGPGDLAIDPAWLDGYGGLLDSLTEEIRSELNREPDTGDLLLALVGAPDALAGRVLGELGVDLDELATTIERIRATGVRTEEDRIEEVRQTKELAIESAQFDDAARLRDEERRLTGDHRRNRAAAHQEIRRRLGISGRKDAP